MGYSPLDLPYANWKSLVSDMAIFYANVSAQGVNGYTAAASRGEMVYVASIFDAADIADFDVVFKPTATVAATSQVALSLAYGASCIQKKPKIGVVTSVAVGIVSATLLAANSKRLGAVVFNDSQQTLYVKLGVTAAADSFTYKLLPGGFLEIPNYIGIVTGVWDLAGAGGSARVTELT